MPGECWLALGRLGSGALKIRVRQQAHGNDASFAHVPEPTCAEPPLWHILSLVSNLGGMGDDTLRCPKCQRELPYANDTYNPETQTCRACGRGETPSVQEAQADAKSAAEVVETDAEIMPAVMSAGLAGLSPPKRKSHLPKCPNRLPPRSAAGAICGSPFAVYAPRPARTRRDQGWCQWQSSRGAESSRTSTDASYPPPAAERGPPAPALSHAQSLRSATGQVGTTFPSCQSLIWGNGGPTPAFSSGTSSRPRNRTYSTAGAFLGEGEGRRAAVHAC